MRKDMFKVIVERPRLRSNDRFNNIRGSVKNRTRNKHRIYDEDDETDYALKESMRKSHVYSKGWDTKSLNENLSPLVRFLRSRCGKKWDDVFSEICENIRTDSTVQQHVRDHVKQYVGANIRVGDDGKLYEYSRYGYRYDEINSKFYVDPRTGILTENVKRSWKSHWKRKNRVNPNHHVAEAGSVEFFRHKGIWYHLNIRKIEEPKVVVEVLEDGTETTSVVNDRGWDIVVGGFVTSGFSRLRGNQLNKKDLKKFGLVNKPE